MLNPSCFAPMCHAKYCLVLKFESLIKCGNYTSLPFSYPRIIPPFIIHDILQTFFHLNHFDIRIYTFIMINRIKRCYILIHYSTSLLCLEMRFYSSILDKKKTNEKIILLSSIISFPNYASVGHRPN